MSLEINTDDILLRYRKAVRRILTNIGIGPDEIDSITKLTLEKILRDVAYVNTNKLRRSNVISDIDDICTVENCATSVFSTIEEILQSQSQSQSKEKMDTVRSFLESNPTHTLLPYEICPDKWKTELQKQESINAHILSSKTGSSVSDSYISCRKCKGKNCVCYTLQTRSADEGMTTIVYCRDCHISRKM
jgi:DNA-directed RNA polymerase subunit M/transcription elongation factor TFIIS